MSYGARGLQLLYSIPSLGFDESNGPPTIVFATHQIIVESLPYSFKGESGFFITNGWLGPLGRYRQRIELFTPTGEPLVESGQRLIEIERDDLPYTVVTRFIGVTFFYAGAYTVAVSVDDRYQVSYPLHIISPNDK